MNAFLREHFPLSSKPASILEIIFDGHTRMLKSDRAKAFERLFQDRCPRELHRFWFFRWSSDRLPMPESGLLNLMVEVGLALDLEEAKQVLPFIRNQTIPLALEESATEESDWWGYRIQSTPDGYVLDHYAYVGL